MSNTIIGTGFLYKIEDLLPFVESWKKYCHDTHLILLVEPECPQEKVSYLKESGVDIRYFTAARFIPSAIHNTRYFKYLDILLENQDKFDRVFLTDVRDVVFQGDVFAEISEPGLHCFMEDKDWTCDERFNKQILTLNYGKTIAAEFKDKRIICSGTTLGDTKDIIKYIIALMNQRDLKRMMEVGGIPDEQACHNFIFHNNMLPHKKQENGCGVATICLTSPDKIKILPDTRVSFYDNLVPAVVHQWDRHQNLVDLYKRIYTVKRNQQVLQDDLLLEGLTRNMSI